MVNWDEKAEDEARETYFSAMPTAIQTRMVSPFVEGARWQRDQLRTDEAVERVALSLLHSDWPADEGDREYHWEHFADTYIEKARAAITALLGDTE